MQAGEVIAGRYRVRKLLGEGGTGNVYLVDDLTAQGVQWALKELISAGLGAGERIEAQSMFDREVAMLKSLNHPGIPKYIDSFSDGAHCYCVMEYIEGETLQSLISKRGKRYGADEILPYALQIARILAYLHESDRPVIFRDLKPSNIMVTAGGRIKLIDFGIARHFLAGKKKDTYLMGSPGFAPPEQYGKGQTDRRSDIYSLGATLYFLLSAGDMAGFKFVFPFLRESDPSIPPWLDRVILKCLAKDPDERFQSAGELIEALEKGPEASSTAPAPLTRPLNPPYSIDRIIVQGALVIVGILSLTGISTGTLVALTALLAALLFMHTIDEQVSPARTLTVPFVLMGTGAAACLVWLLLTPLSFLVMASLVACMIYYNFRLVSLWPTTAKTGLQPGGWSLWRGVAALALLLFIGIIAATLLPDIASTGCSPEPRPGLLLIALLLASYGFFDFPESYTNIWGTWKLFGDLIRGIMEMALVALFALSIVGATFIHSPCQGPLTACKSNLKNIGTACEMYSTDNGGLYPKKLSQITPSYLRQIPPCASAGKMTYSYVSSGDGKTYTAWCSGSFHKRLLHSENYPQYDSIEGLIER
ncbi:MAG: serine/threonine-protein kinase [Candidatus Eremiobacteraeota bacterium]|nr:serine/threonine-protein kinase [Candidatus Eremiobacteraeota bacterium]